MSDLSLWAQTRALVGRIADGFSDEQLLIVPDGWSNNVLWHLGHVVAVQQRLHYQLSNLPLLIDAEFAALFERGTSPADWSTTPDIAAVRTAVTSMIEPTLADVAAGKFTEFTPYTSSAGVEIATFDDAIGFNIFHEGMHVGAIMRLKKAIG